MIAISVSRTTLAQDYALGGCVYINLITKSV